MPKTKSIFKSLVVLVLCAFIAMGSLMTPTTAFAASNNGGGIAREDGISISWGKSVFKYTGKAKKLSIKVRYNGKKLKNKKDYKLTYENNKNVGQATCVVTFKGKYKKHASERIGFMIIPGKVKGLKAKASKDSITITWKPQKVFGTYVAITEKGKNASLHTEAMVPASQASYTFTGLKSKTRYQVFVIAKAAPGPEPYLTAAKKTVKTK